MWTTAVPPKLKVLAANTFISNDNGHPGHQSDSSQATNYHIN